MGRVHLHMHVLFLRMKKSAHTLTSFLSALSSSHALEEHVGRLSICRIQFEYDPEFEISNTGLFLAPRDVTIKK